ncbi:hypothetical protein CALVIDRAFT_594753 [Calocera viscosa TUFC12733]|uniref:Uncharacterized protein n=1 Tax=Calocera viscosa (strain TUFC12733) TaxID=1330018 RepID=A0A167RT70_CALVF|nr:hypothetical protein CALVIDRAFT_594753 [Calocera viscosa TUFC12733]
MASLAPYNISLTSSSPAFIYEPFRDGWYALEGDPAGGWRGSFSNITTWPSPGLNSIGSGVPLRETYLDGANVTLQFEGTAVYLCLTPTRSSFTFTVDDTPVSTTGPVSDLACINSGAQVMAYADDLAYGEHSATVRVNSQGNADFLFYGGLVTVGVNGTNPVVQGIDDTDPGWTYQTQGAWTFSPSSTNVTDSNYNTTLHWTCSYGPSYTASYTFNGSSAVQLLGLLTLNIGPYTIQMDGKSYVYNGSDLWREEQQVIFFKGALDPTKEYTLTLSNYDAAAPNAQQPIGPDYYPCAGVQKLILTKTIPGAPPASGSGNTTTAGAGTGNGASPGAGSTVSSPAGAIAGGVVGGIAALCIVAFFLWFFVWRRRRGQLKTAATTEIDPLPHPSMTEVTPYLLSDLTYSPVSTGDAMRPVREESKLEGYMETRRPSGQTIPTIHTPGMAAVPRSTRRGAKTGHYDTPAEAPSPAVASPAQADTISPTSPATASQGTSSGRTDINGASTQELVTILNRRLRQEYAAENVEMDPPDYEPVD